MSNKRPFDWLGVPGSGGASKRPKPPAPQPSTSSTSNPNPTTSTPINASRPGIQTSTQSSRAGTSSQGQTAGHAMMSTLRNSMRFLKKSCNMVPVLDSAVAALLEPLESIEVSGTDKIDRELQDMASDLPRWAALLSSYLSDTRPEQLSKWIEQLADDLGKQAEDIRALQQRGMLRRLTDTEGEMEVLKRCYSRIEASFRRLQMDVDLSTWKTADDLLKKSQLQELNPTHDARFDSTFSHEVERGECLENTRVSVLEGIRTWIRGDIDAKVHWTNGMAGTGKTTIAYSVCVELDHDKRLGASFFCSRASSDCRDVGRILPTIAYQLAQQSYPFRSSLCRILCKHPNIGQRNISVQFNYLIHHPMLEVKDLLPTGLIIVIDALDECTNPKAVDVMLGAVFRHTVDLPVRFFLTSRPEPSIMATMLSRDNQSHSILHLHNIEEQLVKGDIETYLTVKLASLSLGHDQINQLAERAGILFIYAATVARYLLETSSGAYASIRLQSILTRNTQNTTIVTQDIDVLYKTIIDGVLSRRMERDEMKLTREVLWTVICAREPLAIGTLAILLRTNHNMVTSALQPLRSVLHVSESSEVVSTLHASFAEFLLGSSRCGETLWCNEKLHSEFMAKRCFEVMAEQLRFNICRLETSLRYDEDVPGLEHRVKALISAELAYACRYWSNHLCRSSVSDHLQTSVNELLEVRLLFWMEVLNLNGWMSSARNILSETDEWLSGSPFTDTSGLVLDVYEFATAFAANPVRHSTPHIYISALALYPKQTRVWEIYSKRMQGLIAVGGTLTGQRGRVARWTVDFNVTSMAYSPDGDWIVFCTDKGDIDIWDAYGGAPLGGLIKTRIKDICSIALSPDNSLVAFGSGDGVIGVWHARNGSPFCNSFTGHTGIVKSVVFSPDGTRIASGSRDGTVRIWDVCSGSSIHGPLNSHASEVNCVVFSPDGGLVAYACDDSRVRVWDMRSGSSLTPPFEGHTGVCRSLAFSRDGTRIVSSSSDGRVQVWNPHTGTPIGGPLREGYSSGADAVAFTSDGAYILSAQSQPMAQVWDVYRGTLAVSSPELGTDYNGYDCVALSPNGTHSAAFSSTYESNSIVLWEAGTSAPMDIMFQPDSGDTCATPSADFTRVAMSTHRRSEFCVLDSHTGVPICTSFMGQAGEILDLVFSPDGSRIISSSNDRMVREWDACSGALISTPFVGVDTIHYGLTYSPDGTYLLARGDGGVIRLWDMQQGKLIKTLPLSQDTATITLSPNGAHIASGSRAGIIQMSDVRSGEPVGDPFGRGSDRIHLIVFSSNGTLIAVGDATHTIEVWEVQRGTSVTLISEGTPSSENVVFISGDSRIASATSEGVRVWDINTGALVGAICEGYFGAIISFGLLPTGTHVGIVSCYLGYTAVWQFPIDPPSSTLPCTLDINDDGWVVNPDSKAPIFWLPAELCGGRSHVHIAASNTLLVLPSGTFSLDFSNILIGESWEQCYSLEHPV